MFGCATAGSESSSAMTGMRPTDENAVRLEPGEKGDLGILSLDLGYTAVV